jgi:CBS domain-containing protein
MKAKDIMTTDVVAVGPEDTVADIAALMHARRISGLPVVERDGRLVGIVSEDDLTRRAEIGTDERPRSWWLRLFASNDRLAGEFAKSHGTRAHDVMTKDVVTVEEDTPVAEIATLLETRHIKRVPVVRAGKVVGIVSRANLVQAMAAMRGRTPAHHPSDVEIRRLLVEKVKDQPWANFRTTNVTVADGVVELWGLVFSDEERHAWRVAAEEVPGVREVVDRREQLPSVGDLLQGA